MYQFDNTMGCGQAVRHLILDQRIVGSNPTIPANIKAPPMGALLYLLEIDSNRTAKPRFDSRESAQENTFYEHF
jgi:hypothetical protein